jgi:hypothetical protein
MEKSNNANNINAQLVWENHRLTTIVATHLQVSHLDSGQVFLTFGEVEIPAGNFSGNANLTIHAVARIALTPESLESFTRLMTEQCEIIAMKRLLALQAVASEIKATGNE